MVHTNQESPTHDTSHQTPRGLGLRPRAHSLSHIRFLDRDAITTACDFTDRYTNIDTSWIGTPAGTRAAEG